MKLPLESSLLAAAMKDIDFFDAETQVYRDVIPELEQMYAAAGVDVKFAAMYHAVNTDQHNILLEDLNAKGFRCANRTEGLDLLHTKCVLQKIAQWHAATACRIALKGKYNATLSTGFNSPARLALMAHLNGSMSAAFMNNLASYEGHEKYAKSLVSMAFLNFG